MQLNETVAHDILSNVSYFRLKPYSQDQKKTPYFTISNMLYLCNAVRPDNHVKENLKALFAKYQSVNPKRWGFLDGWDKEPIWK